MRLVTLEGLPKTCTEVLRVLTQTKSVAVLPSPIIPSCTSAHSSPGDDVCTILSNSITRLKILQRMNHGMHSTHVVCGGCHWIESPPIGSRGRAILHRLNLELSMAIAEVLGIVVERHIIMLLKSSVHECFENLLGDVESRDHSMHDLIEESSFLESLSNVPGIMSAFPYTVRKIVCPPFMRDNPYDVWTTAMRISGIIKSVP